MPLVALVTFRVWEAVAVVVPAVAAKLKAEGDKVMAFVPPMTRVIGMDTGVVLAPVGVTVTVPV